MIMNLDETRLKEIQEFKTFYHNKLETEDTEIGKLLLQEKIKELTIEENDILQRCKVEI